MLIDIIFEYNFVFINKDLSKPQRQTLHTEKNQPSTHTTTKQKTRFKETKDNT